MSLGPECRADCSKRRCLAEIFHARHLYNASYTLGCVITASGISVLDKESYG
jgi:hypothetical protein